ncbi:MAG: hypothetical protein QGF90_04105 [Gammaproteobacteria bacterium]|jgi:hypothetical protein|nr:hypothetical protein [Gammaproteobacteria bacterium]
MSWLKEAVDFALAKRSEIWERIGKVIPFDSEDRPLIVGYTDGTKVTKDNWKNAWDRFTTLAIKEGVITKKEYFSLHDMKRRGVTDTDGTREERKDASGHKTDEAFDCIPSEHMGPIRLKS